MKNSAKIFLVLMVLASLLSAQEAVQRFPRPQFENGYQQPATTTPAPRTTAMEYLDVVLLAAGLGLAGYFSIHRRSRPALFVLMLFSLLYFGFWRKGCICPVGSLQNVTLGLLNPAYVVPWTVVLFFVLPLLFSLFVGRAFCSSVCPLGALQDLFAIKPIQLPAWLERTLRILPYTYLGLVLLFVITGSGFILCRFDPFVGFFRRSASFEMVLFGLIFLGLGTVIARPYCRFLCPYGLVMSWLSRLSYKNITITPKECIQCRLCEQACPFGAITIPNETAPPENTKKRINKLLWQLLLVPVVAIVGAGLGTLLHPPLARMHPTIQLIDTLQQQEAGVLTIETLETKAFRSSGKSVEILLAEAEAIQGKFAIGSGLFGMMVALVIHFKMMSLSLYRRRSDYVADRSHCLSCGRCFAYCPVEIERRQKQEARSQPQKVWDWL
jgi:NosR/NirI family transcriptional regulator, nitrous oxide reductase regulator